MVAQGRTSFTQRTKFKRGLIGVSWWLDGLCEKKAYKVKYCHSFWLLTPFDSLQWNFLQVINIKCTCRCCKPSSNVAWFTVSKVAWPCGGYWSLNNSSSFTCISCLCKMETEILLQKLMSNLIILLKYFFNGPLLNSISNNFNFCVGNETAYVVQMICSRIALNLNFWEKR